MNLLDKLAKECLQKYLDEYSQVAAVAWNEKGAILYCNRAFLNLMQTRVEPVGENIADFLHFPVLPGQSGSFGGTPDCLSLRLKTKDAEYRCNATVFEFEQGHVAFCEKPILLQNDFAEKMAKMNLELTNLTWELKQKSRTIEVINRTLEQETLELQESERRYRQLVEDTNVIILTFDDAGKIRYMNEYGRVFLGYDGEEIVGRRLFDTIVPEFDSGGNNRWEILETMLAKGEAFQRYTGENLLRGGKRVWVDWTLRRLGEARGTNTEYMAVGVDVTGARRNREEERNGYDRRRRSEVLNEAIAKRISSAELQNAGKQIGLNLSGLFVCMVFHEAASGLPVASEMDPVEKQHRQNLLIDYLYHAKAGFVWQSPEGIAVLQASTPGTGAILRRQALLQAAETAGKLKKISPELTLRCGVTHAPQPSVTLAELYGQALAAAGYGPTLLGFREIYHWQELGSYQFVIRNIHSREAAQFVEDQLGPLLALGNREKQTELLRTLNEIVTNDSVENIGRRLNIVSRTVRYRKQILEKMLGVDLDLVENLANLSLALKIMSIRGVTRR